MKDEKGSAQGLAGHISGLAEEVSRLEARVAALLPPGQRGQAPLLVELQSLDRLRQSLEDLAAITCSARVEIDATPELTARLQLEDSRRLLDSGHQVPAPQKQSGELDLF